MDPINLLVGIVLFVGSAANFSGAKKGLRTKLSETSERPKTYLQKTPPNISALVLVLLILGVFKIGVVDLNSQTDYLTLRTTGLILYALFSWLQVKSYKELGEYYTQDIAILKKHKLITTGIYTYIRHPQYSAQILADLTGAAALMSDVAVPLVLLVELPLFILRAKVEDKLLEKYFREEFAAYKKKAGFFIPFFG